MKLHSQFRVVQLDKVLCVIDCLVCIALGGRRSIGSLSTNLCTNVDIFVEISLGYVLPVATPDDRTTNPA